MVVNCIPYGGISNRMKCIISTLVEYGDIRLIWNIPNGGGGVRCEFSDLFENEYNQTHDSKLKDISSCEFIHNHMNTNNSVAIDTITEAMSERYKSVIRSLRPIEYIKGRINEELDKLHNDFDVFSVRTFKSFPRENKRWGIHFKIDRLFKVMNLSNSKFLLTCDDNSTVNEIKNRYGDRVIMIPKRTSFGDFKSVSGMQDILIDQYIGGFAKNIYGTYMSSYSEMQWWYGLKSSNYIQMKLHE